MFFFLATDRSDKDSVVHCTLQVGHSGDPSGDIYCRFYTYCRRRQFMMVLAANIVALKHILSPGWVYCRRRQHVPDCAAYILDPHCKTL